MQHINPERRERKQICDRLRIKPKRLRRLEQEARRRGITTADLHKVILEVGRGKV
jgi:hypothetical protein